MKNVSALLLILASTLNLLAQDNGNVPVWRAQVRISTCDKKDANTDDAVYCELKSGNRTYLNYPHDDFERNKTFTYDLTIDGISAIRDIECLRIKKNGDNGVCLSKVTLILNENTVFEKTISGGRWLDGSENDRTMTIGLPELQSDSRWSRLDMARTALSVVSISNTDLESIITAHVANKMHGQRLKWGPKHGRAAVEVSRKNNTALKVDLDTHIDVPNWFDPEADIDFDITICKNVNGSPQSVFDVSNVNVSVDSKWYSEIIFGIGEIIDSKIQDGIGKSLNGIIRIRTPASNYGCFSIDANGNLSIQLQ